jgi:hypothetical protein
MTTPNKTFQDAIDLLSQAVEYLWMAIESTDELERDVLRIDAMTTLQDVIQTLRVQP